MSESLPAFLRTYTISGPLLEAGDLLWPGFGGQGTRDRRLSPPADSTDVRPHGRDLDHRVLQTRCRHLTALAGRLERLRENTTSPSESSYAVLLSTAKKLSID